MKPIEQRIACAKGEILNAMATISTEHDLSATVMEGVLADILSEVKSQSKMELLNAYNKEVNDAQQEIKQLKEELEKAKAAAAAGRTPPCSRVRSRSGMLRTDC